MSAKKTDEDDPKKGRIPKGRQPDYKLSALNKQTEERGNIGVAWLAENGRISIKLNSFIVLSASPDLVISLFPFDE